MDEKRLAEIEAKLEQAREYDHSGTPADMARLTALAMDMVDRDVSDLVAEVRRLRGLVWQADCRPVYPGGPCPIEVHS